MTGPRSNSANVRSAGEPPEKHPRSLECSRPPKAMLPGKNESPIAPDVGGLFFPQSQALGIDRAGFSPSVQQKMLHAGVNSVSYEQASRDLKALSELNIKPKPVERLVRKIGQERIDQRDKAVAAHQRLPLMAKDAVADSKRSTPSVAMVSVDGGRIQIRSDSSEPKTRKSLAGVESRGPGDLPKWDPRRRSRPRRASLFSRSEADQRDGPRPGPRPAGGPGVRSPSQEPGRG